MIEYVGAFFSGITFAVSVCVGAWLARMAMKAGLRASQDAFLAHQERVEDRLAKYVEHMGVVADACRVYMDYVKQTDIMVTGSVVADSDGWLTQDKMKEMFAMLPKGQGMNKFWMVVDERAGSVCKERHSTQAEAIQEAERLCVQEGRGFVVLEAMRVCEPTKLVTWKDVNCTQDFVAAAHVAGMTDRTERPF